MLNAILKNVRLIDPVTKTDAVGNYAVREGLFTAFSHDSENNTALPVIDASGCVLTPGLRDIHVHFRDPGVPEAETRASGAAAAAAGGFTCVTTMPNTTPAGDSAAWIREQIEDASLPVRIAPSACLSRGRLGHETADLAALAAAGAVAFTDDGAFLADASVMRAAMTCAAALGKPVMEHAVVPSLLAGGVIRDCAVARQNHLPVMPPEAETEAVRRDIMLCRETGCALHIQHISCAGTIDLIRAAQRESLPVSGEATPHHLLLACEEIPGDDANWKMAPPLGTHDDRAAIRAAVSDGTLALFATDHAPHPAAKKQGGFAKAANGIVGLETAAAVTWKAMVEDAGLCPLDWAARWCVGPARLIGETPRSLLTPNALADFTLIDLHAKRTVRPETFLSRSRNTPFTGSCFNARPILTVHDGRVTFHTDVLSLH